MADAEYIEINTGQNMNKIESEKLNDDPEEKESEADPEDGMSDDTNETEVKKSEEQEEESPKIPSEIPLSNLPDVVSDGDSMHGQHDPPESAEEQTKEVNKNKEMSTSQSISPTSTDPITTDDTEPYEVINEGDVKEDVTRKGQTDAQITHPEEKPITSPFHRFRTISKPSDKKVQERGSTITLPSIFSDISTSFMSLTSRSKKKESPSDDTQLKDMATEDSTPSPVPSTTSSSTVEQLRIERRNLLGMAKLSIKGLIESSLSAGHTLDSDHAPLQQFFVIMEAVLRHGLKSPKLFFAGNKQFWGPLEAIEKVASDASEIANSVRELPSIKTHVGRARAWLRLALMQKRLADYFRLMVEHRDLMKEFYDTESLILSEEGVVLSGHLVGLNCIDANLCMKGDDLDNQSAVIDYSLYIRDGNRLSVSSDTDLTTGGSQEDDGAEQEGENPEEQIQKLANQKNYLEERNRYLETTLGELQKKAGHTSSSNQLLEAELEAAKISLVALQEERERLMEEKENMTIAHKKILNDRQNDLDMERDTLIQSRAGLDEMLNQVKKQLKHETQMRMDVEREVELQISLKQEMEVAMKLLEKDIYDKQDSLVILREQLDNVKSINIEIYKKLQDKTDAVESKGKAILSLEEETKRLNTEVGKLKEKIAEASRQLDVALERADRYAQNLDDSEKRRNALETNLQIEREWRMALELQVEKSGKQITQLETELSMMQLLRQELAEVKNERDELKSTCEEQEGTISDLADHLGQSKQSFQDLKDVHKSITSKTWEKDKEVNSCAQCEKQFSLARRKHHCRNCGQIFCNTCSDNTMPLASSAKPVRVCDACHTVLLQRYSAATP